MFSLIAVITIILPGSFAFTTSTKISTGQPFVVAMTKTSYSGYIPDGLTRDQYEQIKISDAKKTKGKNLGALGPRGFKSRSLTAFQQAQEKGKAKHLFSPIGYRDQIKKGVMKKEDVPYMVRGGSWDISDVFGARRLKRSKTDAEYEKGGYKKEQSASLLGTGPGFDWTGKRHGSGKGTKSVPGFFS
jgi:hypothetical protein